jgi:hypothetical protein
MYARNRRLGKFAALMFTRIVYAAISKFDHASRGPGNNAFRAFPFGLILSVSLPGLSGQTSIHWWGLLDRPVKPGDDSRTGVNPIENTLSTATAALPKN